MTRLSNRPFSIGITVSMIFALSAFASISTAQDEELPAGESIVHKYVEATGGQAAYDKINNRYFEAEIEIVNAGIVLHVKTYAAKPNRLIATIESEEVGTIHKGCTGTAVWSMSDLQGPVVEEGAALENQLRDHLFDRFAYWKDSYRSVECVAVESVNDNECYKVVFTPQPYESDDAKDDEVSLLTVFFDKTTHLATKIESSLVTAAGTIDVVAYLSDYKTVDGILLPHKTRLELVGQTRLMTVTLIKHNLELAENHFDPPAEIQALIEKFEDRKK